MLPLSVQILPHTNTNPQATAANSTVAQAAPILGRPVVPGPQVVPWQTNLCLCTSHITYLTLKHVPHSHQRKRPLHSLQTQVKPFTLPI